MKGMFRNWTIGKKLTGAFALMSILVALVGVIGALDVNRVRREADVITDVGERGGPVRGDSGGHAEADRRGEGLPALGRFEAARPAPQPGRSGSSPGWTPRSPAPATSDDTKRAEALEQVKVKTKGYETTFLEAVSLYESKRTIEAVNLSMNESEVRADQMVSGLGELIRENDAQLDLVVADAGADRHRDRVGAARDLLRPASEPQHQPAAARAGAGRRARRRRATSRRASRSIATTRSDRWPIPSTR